MIKVLSVAIALIILLLMVFFLGVIETIKIIFFILVASLIVLFFTVLKIKLLKYLNPGITEEEIEGAFAVDNVEANNTSFL